MSRWIISRSLNEVALTHETLDTGRWILWDCGSQLDMSDDEVVRWIRQQSNCEPGDVVIFDDGLTLPLRPSVYA